MSGLSVCIRHRNPQHAGATFTRTPSRTTPIFAQAYGLKCTACHLHVPVLNSFGRYIQRTGYGALNYKALQHTFPVFLFDLGTSYTYQAGQPAQSYKISDPLQTTILYAAGALGPKFSYNIEHGVTLAASVDGC